jgi:hypothetical protein
MDIDLSDMKSSDSAVPLTARDRQFFTELDHFMNTESAKIGESPSRERFAVFRLAFEKVCIIYLFEKEKTFFQKN